MNGYKPHDTNPQTHYCHCPITQPRDCELKYHEKVIKYQAEIDRLTGELARYKQGVEVDGNYIWWEQCIANVSLDKDKFRGKKVKAFVIPIEESCDE